MYRNFHFTFKTRNTATAISELDLVTVFLLHRDTNHKVMAIKQLRRLANLDLYEAKHLVDYILAHGYLLFESVEPEKVSGFGLETPPSVVTFTGATG